MLFSNSLFNLQVPVLGQGLNINPGLAWVVPVGETVVLGLAGSFQYRGPYKPREGLGEYDPGDEITASAGLDFRVNETVSVSTDFVFSAYTADKFDGAKVFASGNAYWVNVQYRQLSGRTSCRYSPGYRTKSKGQIAGVGGLVDEKEQAGTRPARPLGAIPRRVQRRGSTSRSASRRASLSQPPRSSRGRGSSAPG